MEMQYEQYEGVTVGYKDRSVHITSDDALEAYLSGPGEDALALSDHVLAHYEDLLGKPLDISRESLAIEILAHVFAEQFAEGVASVAEKLPDLVRDPLTKLSEKVIERTDIIDCGEREVDSNRFVWDMLVPFRGLIFRVMGDRA